MRQTVESPYPQAVGRHLQHVLDPATHLTSRFIGEGDGQNGMGRKPLGPNQPGNAVHQHPGFTRACARQDQQVA